jgi:hypothetical protein
MLEQAAEGFGEFASGGRDRPLAAEAASGAPRVPRADHSDWAIADCAVADSKATSPDKVRKAPPPQASISGAQPSR